MTDKNAGLLLDKILHVLGVGDLNINSRGLLEGYIREYTAPPAEAVTEDAREALDELSVTIQRYEDASLRLDTGEIKRQVYKIRTALQSPSKAVDAEVIEKILDAKTEWQISRATGNPDIEHEKAVALVKALALLSPKDGQAGAL